MVQLIVGKEGKGKTTHLLDKVNEEIKKVEGSIVYVDYNAKHMFELNNRIRLMNISDFDFDNCSEFVGFIYGIISQDHDMQQMYIDGIMKVAKLEKKDITSIVKKMEKISNTFNFDFIVSISADVSDLDEEISKNIIVAL